MKKYLFVTTHFAPDFHYGGVVESGTRLYKYMSRLSAYKLSCVSRQPDEVIKYAGPNVSCYKSFYLHKFGFSLSAIFGLWRDIANADVIMINGIFTFPVTLAQFYAILQNKSFGVAVRGGLEPWRVSHKKWKKYFYIKFITLPLMRKAKFIHVTSEEEKQNIEAFDFQNTVLVTNGIDLEQFSHLPQKYSFGDDFGEKFVFLFLSRTDKEKGLDILIEAYRNFCSKYTTDKYILLIVGPDHQNYLKNMKLDYKNENIVYIDGIYGDDKIKLIRRSDVVLLPSYSENFGNIIAEGFACERPVITSTGTPWSEIENIGCGLYVEPNADELYSAMQKIYDMSNEERETMGIKGRTYIESFDWATKAKELYDQLEKL